MRAVPRSGTFRQLGAALERAHRQILDGQQSVWTGTDGCRDRYLLAVHQASTELHSHLDRRQLDGMLRPAVYFTVLGATTTDQQMVRAINGEYDRLREVLEQQRESAVHQDQYWAAAGSLVLPDTSYWVEEWRDFESLNFEELFGQHAESEMTLVVPMAVVDELDNVSHRRSSDDAAQRAKAASRFIQKYAGGPSAEPSTVRVRDLTLGNMAVQLAVVDFSPEHERAPINDDEIVGVAATLSAATGSRVLLVSGDTAGFPLRARLAGQKVLKADVPDRPPKQARKGST